MRRVLLDEDVPRQLRRDFQIGLVVLALRDTRLPSILSKLDTIEAALVSIGAGEVIRITD